MDITSIYEQAHAMALESHCIYRGYGVVVASNDCVIATGYAHVLLGRPCYELSCCPRRELIDRFGEISEFFEKCRVIHAEMDAILNAENPRDLEGSTLYLLGIERPGNRLYSGAFPCSVCLRHIVKVGIRTIAVFCDGENAKEFHVSELSYLA